MLLDYRHKYISMQRRHFLFAVSSTLVMLATRSFAGLASIGVRVSIVLFSDNARAIRRATLPKVHKDSEWRKTLSPLAYRVTREKGTEEPYSIPGFDRHESGLYRCICCGNALFDANTKYDSHTGWPSFWQPIAPENVHEVNDNQFGMNRTEVQCALCDAHLGHVFDDGPKPTGLRYCMNTVAMRFVRTPKKP